MTTNVVEAAVPRVLVVEDHEDLLMSRLKLLASHGVEAVGTTRAEYAAAFLLGSREPISLAIIDVNLRAQDADRSGLDLARLLRLGGLGIPVVGYSAHFESRGDGLSPDERSEFTNWYERASLTVEKLDELYATFAVTAVTAAAASHSATLAIGPVSPDAVGSFLDATESGAGPEVAAARRYIAEMQALFAEPYDPLTPGAPYDPHQDDAVPKPPKSVSKQIVHVGPTFTDEK